MSGIDEAKDAFVAWAFCEYSPTLENDEGQRGDLRIHVQGKGAKRVVDVTGFCMLWELHVDLRGCVGCALRARAILWAANSFLQPFALARAGMEEV